MLRITMLSLTALVLTGCRTADTGGFASDNSPRGQELFRMQSVQTRWASFENPLGAKGQAARANRGAKGSSFKVLKAGESKTLLDVKGSGVIRRFWLTMLDKSPQMLRGVRLDMY